MLIEEESDPDKIMLALNAILGILIEFKEKIKFKTKNIEISAASSYFLGRVGGYKSSAVILKELGFDLISSKHTGLILNIKKTSQSIQKIKNFGQILKDFISDFKDARRNDQFLPDYEF